MAFDLTRSSHARPRHDAALRLATRGPTSLSPAQAAQTPALSAGTKLAAAAGASSTFTVTVRQRRAGCARETKKRRMERAGGVPTTADDVLIRDQFAFGVCDADGACSASNASVEPWCTTRWVRLLGRPP